MKPCSFGARLALSALCMVLLAGACGAQGDSAVATVNGEAISAADFYERVQQVSVREFIVSTTPLTVRAQTAGQIVLDQMINERLTLQWASKTGLLPPEAEVDAEFARAKSQPQLRQALAAHVLAEETIKQNIRYARARFNLATTGTTVTPAEVEKYYKDHVASYTAPERYSLEGLRTDKPDDVPKIEAAVKAGKPFPEVVKTYCTDKALVDRNGVMGTFNATDQTIPAPVREAAAALKDGQVSGPVKIEAEAGPGKPKATIWWFLRMAHRQPPTVTPFAVVQKQAEQAAMLEKAGGIQTADKKIADFRRLSEIKINLPGYDMLLPKPKP
jgi:parvulin-like peptidyl-prolyl isomerase